MEDMICIHKADMTNNTEIFPYTNVFMTEVMTSSFVWSLILITAVSLWNTTIPSAGQINLLQSEWYAVPSLSLGSPGPVWAWSVWMQVPWAGAEVVDQFSVRYNSIAAVRIHNKPPYIAHVKCLSGLSCGIWGVKQKWRYMHEYCFYFHTIQSNKWRGIQNKYHIHIHVPVHINP